MKFWVWLLSILESEMPVPTTYGWFHLLWIALAVSFTAFLCRRFGDCSDLVMRRIAIIVFITLIVADLYRQIVYDFVSYDAELERFVWDYGWYAFPFQLCSAVHYVLPFVIWGREGHVRDACISFLCFFSTLGGVAVFLFPESCFTPSVGVNIQTMLHHGMQISLGIFFAFHERRKLTLRYFLRGVPVFLALVVVAIILNFTVHHVFVLIGSNDVFDMFYISPYYTPALPIIGVLKPALPYPIFLFVYILAICLGAFLIYATIIAAIFKKESISKSGLNIFSIEKKGE